ncbi:hypothetical protein [Sphingopyxis sp.]|uniref:hypothetical protein n=1 Tax=Sphingopyxis sp. TaxID=1908224 RepID=UPI003D0BF400
MFKPNKGIVLEALEELSDKDFQEYYWMGRDQSVMCVPEELCHSMLFSSNLSLNVKAGRSVFGHWDARIMALAERFCDLVERTSGDVEAMLAAAEMNQIRTEAQSILNGMKG